MQKKKTPWEQTYNYRLDEAQGFSDVWEIVKDTVRSSLGEHRVAMMLFLDDLPMGLGAYHPLGTNNIVLNRTLVQIVEATTKSRRLLNAFVYNLLLHEYLHALGHIPESAVRHLVYKVSRESFGENHVASHPAKTGLRSILRNVPLNHNQGTESGMEIVKDFDKTNRTYIS